MRVIPQQPGRILRQPGHLGVEQSSLRHLSGCRGPYRDMGQGHPLGPMIKILNDHLDERLSLREMLKAGWKTTVLCVRRSNF